MHKINLLLSNLHDHYFYDILKNLQHQDGVVRYTLQKPLYVWNFDSRVLHNHYIVLIQGLNLPHVRWYYVYMNFWHEYYVKKYPYHQQILILKLYFLMIHIYHQLNLLYWSSKNTNSFVA